LPDEVVRWGRLSEETGKNATLQSQP